MLRMLRKQPDAPQFVRRPDSDRTFGIAGCLYLLFSLPTKTQEYFLLWNVIGIALYWVYGSRQAAKARAAR